ncbi:MAG: hypothetical protein SGI77_08390 [Pirellulaceae bacterium]|nr:hypothetical protein [Pirellulaceae bacterium]
MKILLPCPACQNPLSPPRQASQSAVLRCSHCGHLLSANAIVADDDQLEGSWEVIEDAGSGNFFASFFSLEASDASSVATNESNSPSDEAMETPSSEVPQSNEWETQSATIPYDEPLETDDEHRIGDKRSLSEIVASGNDVIPDRETLHDWPMSVSDEPWLSGASENSTESRTLTYDFATEGESRHDDSDEELLEFEDEIPPEGISDNDEKDLTDENVEAGIGENEEESLEFEPDAEPYRLADESPPSKAADLLGSSNLKSRSRKQSSPIGMIVSVIGGGFASIPIAILLIWYLLGTDPFATGPIVAQWVPWIVPTQFRGSPSEPLPELAASSSKRATQNEAPSSGKLPPIGGLEASTSATEPSLATTSVPIEEPTLGMSIATTIEPTLSLESVATESTDLTSLTKPKSSTPDVDPVIQSLDQLADAINRLDLDAPESTSMLYGALTAFGERLAEKPSSENEDVSWREKADTVFESIVSSKPMLFKLKEFIQRDRSLFPDEQLNSADRIPSVDVVQVGAVEKKDVHDVWSIAGQFQLELKLLPFLVPHAVNVPAEPKAAFLVIGVIEPASDSTPKAFSALYAKQIK